MSDSIVVCDFETTGLDPTADKIIEVGLVRLEKGLIIDHYHTLVNPNSPIPLKIKKLTGLDDCDLVNAPLIEHILPDIIEFIGDSTISGHNVQFDLSFLEAARGFPHMGNVYDTLELARLVAPGAPSFRLESLSKWLGLETGPSHRALDDAMAAARLFIALLVRIKEFEHDIIVQLIKLLHIAHSGFYKLFNDIFKENYGLFSDRKISSIHYWQREPIESASLFQPDDALTKKSFLSEHEIAELVRPDGPMKLSLPGYEYRPQQEAMIREIVRAMNDEMYLLMEAGTGVGKSMAYLLPSVFWALHNKQRVLVSTHTINLQEQLWLKDIPMLSQVLNQPLKVALAKGRQNYICLRRWFIALESVSQPDEAAFLARVLTWLSVTDSGDKSEINILPNESDFWQNICGDTDGCLGIRCRYQRNCFVNRARKAAEEASLIITNHSLLFADVRTENRVLPSYGPLIIDEAHHLEEAATIHLGRQFSQGALNRWLGAAGKTLAKLSEMTPPSDGGKWIKALGGAQAARLEAAEGARHFFQMLWEMAKQNTSGGQREYGRVSLRMPCSGAGYEEAVAAGERFLELLFGFINKVKACAELVELWSVTGDSWAVPLRDLAQIAESGLAQAYDCEFIIKNQDPGHVYWTEIEVSARGTFKHVLMQASPIDVGTLLYERFFKFKDTVIMVSATLSVGGAFDHYIERGGLSHLSPTKLKAAHFDSPFTYDSQALLCIARDLPTQGQVADSIYIEKIQEAIFRLVQVTAGKTLVLFTSHRTLREVYSRLRDKLENMDINLIGHGIDGSRSRILEEFKNSSRTVLFGASSFWEGVDVPGEGLSCVIMVKLPFDPPSAPVTEARLESLYEKEKDGFLSLSVPHAVIRFKQGFGRLIRSKNDRGCIIVLDGRILNKKYGRHFLNSLPLQSHFRGDINTVANKVSSWMGRK